MQADRMCRAEAAITIQKKTFFLNVEGDIHTMNG